MRLNRESTNEDRRAYVRKWIKPLVAQVKDFEEGKPLSRTCKLNVLAKSVNCCSERDQMNVAILMVKDEATAFLAKILGVFDPIDKLHENLSLPNPRVNKPKI